MMKHVSWNDCDCKRGHKPVIVFITENNGEHYIKAYCRICHKSKKAKDIFTLKEQWNEDNKIDEEGDLNG